MVSFNSVSFSVNPTVTLPLNIGLNSTMKGGMNHSAMCGQQMMGDAFLRGVGAGSMMAGMGGMGGMMGMPGMGGMMGMPGMGMGMPGMGMGMPGMGMGMPGFAQGFAAAQGMQQMQQMAQQMSGKQGCKKKKKKKKCCKNKGMDQNALSAMNPMMNPMCRPGMGALGNTMGQFMGAAFKAGAQFGAAAANPFGGLGAMMNPMNSLMSGAGGFLSGLSSPFGSMSSISMTSIRYA